MHNNTSMLRVQCLPLQMQNTHGLKSHRFPMASHGNTCLHIGISKAASNSLQLSWQAVPPSTLPRFPSCWSCLLGRNQYSLGFFLTSCSIVLTSVLLYVCGICISCRSIYPFLYDLPFDVSINVSIYLTILSIYLYLCLRMPIRARPCFSISTHWYLHYLSNRASSNNTDP